MPRRTLARDPQNPECHALRHAWKVTNVYQHPGVKRVEIICLRCTSGAVDLFTDKGVRIGRRVYRYAAGYLLRKADDKPSMADYRVMLFDAYAKRAGKR